MTQDDISRMAREADIDWHKHWRYDESNSLEVFAALVAAAEREACAKACEVYASSTSTPGSLAWAIPQDCAKAIRARGKP